jgi:two-component system chemotaxis response regulator CheB
VDALEQVFCHLPTHLPPIVVVQHMPVGFTKIFAARLNAKYEITVKEAKTGDVLQRGEAMIAPSGQHIRLLNSIGKLVVECFPGERIHGVIPAADVLFESAANILRNQVLGVILTGMGADGAAGLKMMRDYGAHTIGQDKETSTIYGMPKVAMEMGAVEFQLPLHQIAEKMIALAGGN